MRQTPLFMMWSVSVSEWKQSGEAASAHRPTGATKDSCDSRPPWDPPQVTSLGTRTGPLASRVHIQDRRLLLGPQCPLFPQHAAVLAPKTSEHGCIWKGCLRELVTDILQRDQRISTPSGVQPCADTGRRLSEIQEERLRRKQAAHTVVFGL